MKNLTVVSTIFCPSIAGHLSVVSILFSNGKSNCRFHNFLQLHCKQSICCLILLSDRKSKRFFNTFLAFHFRHSIRHFDSFLKLKISPLFQQYFGLALNWMQSIRCFNSFFKWEIVRLFQNFFGFPQ